MPPGGSSQNQSQQSFQGPPQMLVPGLKSGLNYAGNLFNSGAGVVANPSPATQAGWQAATARGLNGSPLNAAAGGYLQDVLGGKYLGGQNLDAIHKSIADATLPSIAGQFSLAGRYGSPDMAGTETKALADAYAPYDYGNYQTERGMQQQAAGMAPNQASQDWTDIAGLQGAGGQQDQLAQAQLDTPYTRLARYMGTLSNPAFGTASNSTGSASQPGGGWGGLLGGILGAVL